MVQQNQQIADVAPQDFATLSKHESLVNVRQHSWRQRHLYGVCVLRTSCLRHAVRCHVSVPSQPSPQPSRSLSDEREPQLDGFATLLGRHVRLIGENIAGQSAPHSTEHSAACSICTLYAAFCVSKTLEICTPLSAVCRSLALSVSICMAHNMHSLIC